MTMRPLSECLESVLMGLGIDVEPVGAGKASDEKAGSRQCGARRQVAAALEGKTTAVRLVWDNPTAMRETPSQGRKPGVSLMIVASN